MALLTFAMQAENWGQGAEAFLRVNTLIHLLNAIVLAACLYQLSLLQSIKRNQAVIVAVAAAGCWVMMPLLATASLLVVQRMTTLSAMFMLMTLFAYLLARKNLEASPRPSLALMSVVVAIGTLLAALSKETGALLPALLLVLEATVLRRPAGLGRYWHAWQGVFLVLPTALIAGYLVMRFNYSDSDIARSGFTGGERLITQANLLWVYLQKAALGSASALGVYQSPPGISHSLFEPKALLSSISWVVLTIAAVAYRRRWPLFSLAVLWYLTGHAIESTVMPLEPYFEHRNYLPVVGPVYAAVLALVTGREHLRRVAMVAVPLYIIVSAFILYTFASLSGEPSTASRFWAQRYPDSVRAVTTMATYQLSEEGPIRTLSTIDRFVIEHPEHGYLRIQELNIRCIFMPEQDHGTVLAELRQALPEVRFTHTAGTMISQLFSTVIKGSCNGVTFDTVADLAQLLQQNPRYSTVTGFQQFHHRLMAGIALQQGDHSGTIAHLEKAIAVRASAELNMMMVTALGGAGDFDGAREFMDGALDRQPWNPLRAIAWRRDLQKLRAYIDELERYSQSDK
jgi:hypothetical protein